jgi:hypothetical protein
LFSATFFRRIWKLIPPAIWKFCAAFVFVGWTEAARLLNAELLLEVLKLPHIEPSFEVIASDLADPRLLPNGLERGQPSSPDMCGHSPEISSAAVRLQHLHKA